MLTRHEIDKAQARAADMLRKAGIAITPAEAGSIEVADFGLGDLQHTGLQLITYVNNDRYCAKELLLFPRQTCPQHRHPPTSSGAPGKQETFRCRWGVVYLYVTGLPTAAPKAKPPIGREKAYSVWHEITLRPGEQFTIAPDTWHWFQAGDQGAIISEFSSSSTDDADIFADKSVSRSTEVA